MRNGPDSTSRIEATKVENTKNVSSNNNSSEDALNEVRGAANSTYGVMPEWEFQLRERAKNGDKEAQKLVKQLDEQNARQEVDKSLKEARGTFAETQKVLQDVAKYFGEEAGVNGEGNAKFYGLFEAYKDVIIERFGAELFESDMFWDFFSSGIAIIYGTYDGKESNQNDNYNKDIQNDKNIKEVKSYEEFHEHLLKFAEVIDFLINYTKSEKVSSNSEYTDELHVGREIEATIVKEYFTDNFAKVGKFEFIDSENTINTIRSADEFYAVYEMGRLPQDAVSAIQNIISQSDKSIQDSIHAYRNHDAQARANEPKREYHKRLWKLKNTEAGKNVWQNIQGILDRNAKKTSANADVITDHVTAIQTGDYSKVFRYANDSQNILSQASSQNIIQSAPSQTQVVSFHNQDFGVIQNTLMSGNKVQIPITSKHSNEKVDMLVYLNDKNNPIVNLYGNEFPIPANLKNFNDFKSYWNLLGETATIPIFKNFFKTRPEESLDYIQKRFAQKYPTEKIGSNKNHFHEIIFTLLGEAMGSEEMQNMDSTQLEKMLQKWTFPENTQNIEVFLREKGIIEGIGAITESSLRQATMKVRLEKVQQESKMDQKKSQMEAEEILSHWPL